ncbi:MAG: GNAT family protein [Chitinophagaceae bacterium]
MQLIPIKEKLEENEEFTSNPLCQETIQPAIDFYKKTGFVKPWIGYYAEENGQLVGCAGFKGQPVNGTIEIAYGTFEKHRKQGMGATICKRLVDLSLATDPSIRITARTLPEENFSTRILKKNNFIFIGTVNDPEDGEVWEWLFKATDSGGKQ